VTLSSFPDPLCSMQSKSCILRLFESLDKGGSISNS